MGSASNKKKGGAPDFCFFPSIQERILGVRQPSLQYGSNQTAGERRGGK
jgi:hypothetical protein